MDSNTLKKCSVNIGGISYQLVTQENEVYTRQIAAKADEMVRSILQNNPQLSQSMATVLALVNAVDELSRADQHIQTIEQKDLDLKHQTSETRQELNRLREQNWEMKKEILRLNDLNRDSQALINRLTQPAAEAAEPAAEQPVPIEEIRSISDVGTENVPEEQENGDSEHPADNDPDAPELTDKRVFQQTDLDDYLRAAGLIADDTVKPES